MNEIKHEQLLFFIAIFELMKEKGDYCLLLKDKYNHALGWADLQFVEYKPVTVKGTHILELGISSPKILVKGEFTNISFAKRVGELQLIDVLVFRHLRVLVNFLCPGDDVHINLVFNFNEQALGYNAEQSKQTLLQKLLEKWDNLSES